MSDAGEKFTSLQELLKSAIFHRQQLKYEQTRRYVISIPFISLISLSVFLYVVTLKSSSVFDIILAAVLVWYSTYPGDGSDNLDYIHSQLNSLAIEDSVNPSLIVRHRSVDCHI